MLKVELLEQHFGMEDIFLINVDVDHVIQRLHIVGHKVLNRIDFMIDKMLHPIDIAGKAAHAVVNGHNVRFQLVDQIVQRFKRRNDPAGRDFDIGAEGAQSTFRMALRVGMHADMALIEMGDHGFR